MLKITISLKTCHDSLCHCLTFSKIVVRKQSNLIQSVESCNNKIKFYALVLPVCYHRQAPCHIVQNECWRCKGDCLDYSIFYTGLLNGIMFCIFGELNPAHKTVACLVNRSLQSVRCFKNYTSVPASHRSSESLPWYKGSTSTRMHICLANSCYQWPDSYWNWHSLRNSTTILAFSGKFWNYFGILGEILQLFWHFRGNSATILAFLGKFCNYFGILWEIL